MWLSNRGPLRFAREQEGHQTAEMVAGKLQQQQSVDGVWGWLMGEKNDAPGYGTESVRVTAKWDR